MTEVDHLAARVHVLCALAVVDPVNREVVEVREGVVHRSSLGAASFRISSKQARSKAAGAGQCLASSLVGWSTLRLRTGAATPSFAAGGYRRSDDCAIGRGARCK